MMKNNEEYPYEHSLNSLLDHEYFEQLETFEAHSRMRSMSVNVPELRTIYEE